ncbi:MAG: GNAT family N-acetyltransferase [Chloroflexota bacterium]
MPYTLRPMEPGDIPVVAAIDRLSFPTPWSAAAFRRELKRGHTHYYVLLRPRGAERRSSQRGWRGRLHGLLDLVGRSRIVGYAGFRQEGREGHITTIAVHPDWRGLGLGELLLWVGLQKMVIWGVDEATLEMRPSNEVAFRLYQKYGFDVEARRYGYYQDGDDAWVMAVDVGGDEYGQLLAERRQALMQRLRREQIEVGQNGDDHL